MACGLEIAGRDPAEVCPVPLRYKDQIAQLPAYKPAKLLTGPTAELVKLSSNENPLGPSPLAVAALQAAIGQVHRYPDSGSGALRQALAAHAGLAPAPRVRRSHRRRRGRCPV